MPEIAFNLLDEPWIRLMGEDCTVRECTLPQALLESHRYRRLAGELPTQDVAILRLLLAVLHTVFYRVDLDGEEDPIEEPSQALRRWQQLWKAGCFPEAPIRNYLNEWKDRFWLFHPERPFFQVPSAAAGTPYTAAKLNGELSESRNKVRLFPLRAGQDKNGLSYAEAARWLITLIGFDDSSTKVETGTGVGWLGQHVNLYAMGENLFETLMLNLVLLRNGTEIWDEDIPSWELNEPKVAKKRKIVVPDNQAELLTLQSRRVLLYRENNKVVKYSTTGGDFFGDDGSINAFNEQMTQWIVTKSSKNKAPQAIPKMPNSDKQMWRDFEAIVGQDAIQPGIARWIACLYQKRILKGTVIHFCLVGVTYDSKKSSIADIVSDHLDFHISLLEEAGKLWDKLVQDKIEQTEKAAFHLGVLAEALFKAASGWTDSKATIPRKDLSSQTYYGQVDIPFRKWLASIDPDLGDGEKRRAEKDAQWRREAYRIALEQGRKMVQNAGQAAFTGRWIDGRFYSSPEAFNCFSWQLKKLFNIDNPKKEEADEKP